MMFLTILFTAALCASHASSYTFSCLHDACVCDTDTQVIDCHGQDMFYTPNIKLRRPLHGFTVLSLRENCLTEVPYTRRQIEQSLPDLEAIDLHQNAFTSCSEITSLHYNHVNVMSECENDSNLINEANPPTWLIRRWGECSLQASRRRADAERDCGDWTDIGCHAENIYEKVSVAVTRLVSKIEELWNKHKRTIPGYEAIEAKINEIV